MLKLERLAYAMAEHEGWGTQIDTPATSGTASFRNHNPGNLRASPFEVGKSFGFSIFRTDMDGFAALKWDIMQKAKGNTTTGLNGNSTLSDLIHVWAPSQDGNNPQSYLQDVLHMTGFIATMKLSELLR